MRIKWFTVPFSYYCISHFDFVFFAFLAVAKENNYLGNVLVSIIKWEKFYYNLWNQALPPVCLMSLQCFILSGDDTDSYLSFVLR